MKTISDDYIIIRGDKVVRSTTRPESDTPADTALKVLKPKKDELMYVRVGQQPEPVSK